MTQKHPHHEKYVVDQESPKKTAYTSDPREEAKTLPPIWHASLEEPHGPSPLSGWQGSQQMMGDRVIAAYSTQVVGMCCF